MRESRTLEYKESISSTFLKTVSAFANMVPEKSSLELQMTEKSSEFRIPKQLVWILKTVSMTVLTRFRNTH